MERIQYEILRERLKTLVRDSVNDGLVFTPSDLSLELSRALMELIDEGLEPNINWEMAWKDRHHD